MESENDLRTNKLPSWLTTETSLTKYYSMALFILLPFVGGWIGYGLAMQKVTVAETVYIPQEIKHAGEERNNKAPNDTKESTYKIFPVVSEECKEILSDPEGYYAVYANELTLGQAHRCDYERLTGQTYDLSSTTIRVVGWDEVQRLGGGPTTMYREHAGVNMATELEILTQLPYLTELFATDNKIILTRLCFVPKACSFFGLYTFDLGSKTLSRMMTSEYFDVLSRASVLSPDRTKIISSDYAYDMQSPNSLYYVDLKNDTYKILDTLTPAEGEGTFCQSGMGGCGGLNIEWQADNTIETTIFKAGSMNEIRTYSLEE